MQLWDLCGLLSGETSVTSEDYGKKSNNNNNNHLMSPDIILGKYSK